MLKKLMVLAGFASVLAVASPMGREYGDALRGNDNYRNGHSYSESSSYSVPQKWQGTQPLIRRDEARRDHNRDERLQNRYPYLRRGSGYGYGTGYGSQYQETHGYFTR
ncbi:MAG TPA: hypothetical protein VJ731_11450 [Terriglobales bacterium]|nr:hypothetical protein [Terriglobales bacterium]